MIVKSRLPESRSTLADLNGPTGVRRLRLPPGPISLREDPVVRSFGYGIRWSVLILALITSLVTAAGVAAAGPYTRLQVLLPGETAAP